jgi:archaellum biogenesis ATPase FlaH
MVSSGGLHLLREIDEDLFVGTEKNAYRYIRSFQRQYNTFPSSVTVQEETGVVIPSVAEPFEFYLEKVRTRRLFNAVSEDFGSFRDSLRAKDMEGVREAVSKIAATYRKEIKSDNVKDVSEATNLVLRTYSFAQTNPGLTGVPTPWERVNRVTAGYQPGGLITWVARTSVGKTTLLTYQAYKAWVAGYSVLFVTMEMTIEEISRNLLMFHSGVNSDYMRRGVLSFHAMDRINTSISTFANVDKFRLFSSGMSSKLENIANYIDEFQPDIVFIDGAYLLKPFTPLKNSNKAERVEQIYTDLRDLGLSKRKPLTTTTQYNRQSGARGVGGSLETIGYSDEISKLCSLVFSVNDGPLPFNEVQRNIKILKGRAGEKIDFNIHYTFSPPNFEDVDPPREQDEEQQAQEEVSADVGWDQ